MSTIALPASTSNRKRLLWLAVPIVVALALGATWLVSGRRTASAIVDPSMVFTVHPMDLDITIVKDGELQAVNNIEIVGQVEGTTTIQTLIPEGASVKKGDVLIELDSSAIRQRIEDTTLDLQKAEADVSVSHDLRDIQRSTNAANLQSAQSTLLLAQLDLKQYDEGAYPQLVDNAKTELDMAQINLKNMQEKLSQTQALFAKNFVTSSAVKDDELAVTTASNTVSKAETALRVLTQYTHQMDQASKQNALSLANKGLARVERENAANISQKEADVRAKEQALAVLQRRMERFKEQLAACTIKAPADGLVVYASSGDRFAQNMIQEGAQVRERQPLLRLPDAATMKAVVRIQEAQVPRLQEGMRAQVTIVGYPTPIGATLSRISVLADSAGRFNNPDSKEYPVDLVLDETPPRLKPGISATAQIFIDRARQVLAVPLAAIYSVGSQTFLFVRDGDVFRPREVKVGRANGTHAEVLGDMLHADEQVAILTSGQGQELLEKAGIKPRPTSGPSDGEFRGRRGGRGGRGGRNGNGGAGPLDQSAAPSREAPAGGAASPQEPARPQPSGATPDASNAPPAPAESTAQPPAS